MLRKVSAFIFLMIVVLIHPLFAQETLDFGALLLKAKNSKESRAQYQVGVIYLTGSKHVEKNIIRAIHYFIKSGENGNRNGYRQVANLYREGKLIARNYKTAIHFYRLAVKQGDSESAHILGDLYFFGEGVERDTEKAFDYYESVRLDEAPNHVSAKYKIAYMYYAGLGVNQDYKKAKNYLEIAASHNSQEALQLLGHMYENGEGVDEDPAKSMDYYVRAQQVKLNLYGI